MNYNLNKSTPSTTMDPDPYEETENRIRLALASIPENEKPNLTRLAKEYGVPYSRLRARYHGRGTRTNCGGSNRVLTDAQEQALLGIIKRDEQYGMEMRH
jgi:hypothetical protein